MADMYISVDYDRVKLAQSKQNVFLHLPGPPHFFFFLTFSAPLSKASKSCRFE